MLGIRYTTLAADATAMGKALSEQTHSFARDTDASDTVHLLMGGLTVPSFFPDRGRFQSSRWDRIKSSHVTFIALPDRAAAPGSHGPGQSGLGRKLEGH